MGSHRRLRRQADQAAEQLQQQRRQWQSELDAQRARWRQRAPWLLPLAFVAGLLVQRARPGRRLWRLGRGLLQVGEWLARRDPVYRGSDRLD